VPDDRRGAAFVCALALADPTGAVRFETAGRCRGRITHEPRGNHGFGYDPLFLIPEYHKTFGELSAVVKNQLSHRARALSRLRPALDRMIALGEFAGDRPPATPRRMETPLLDLVSPGAAHWRGHSKRRRPRR